LQLNSSLATAYAAKGSALLLYDWQWKEACESLTKAIELNPAATDAHQLLSLYFLSTGRKNDAVEIMEEAFRVDPLSPIVNKFLADAYLNAGRTDDALRQVELMLDIHPEMPATMELRGWCVGVKGDWRKAAEIFEELHRLAKHPLKRLSPLGCAYANLGETEKALDCIRRIEQRQVEEPGLVLDADLAMIWLSLGERDKAFHHLFQCVEKRMGPVAIIIDHPMFRVPRDDPRYRQLKEKLNLVE
jgi:tetratricopeptide (TPR) repeat protein